MKTTRVNSFRHNAWNAPSPPMKYMKSTTRQSLAYENTDVIKFRSLTIDFLGKGGRKQWEIFIRNSWKPREWSLDDIKLLERNSFRDSARWTLGGKWLLGNRFIYNSQQKQGRWLGSEFEATHTRYYSRETLLEVIHIQEGVSYENRYIVWGRIMIT